MSFGRGALTLAARRCGARTVLERVRYEGISRCSRAFAHGDAALVVLSQLGPGVVRGDDVTTVGHVRADAHLIVTGQSATRVMGGARPSRASAAWTVDDRAVLELLGEPLVAGRDARYGSAATIELGAGSVVLLSEVAAVSAEAAVRVRTSVRRAGRELFFDAFDAASAAPHAVGTFAVVGITDQRSHALVAALDTAADAVDDVRIGIGMLRDGAFARLIGSDVWAIRTALAALREAARSHCVRAEYV